MRKNFRIILPLLAASVSMLVSSCSQTPTSYVVEATVTVKPANRDQTCYLQLDDNTIVKPTNSSFQTNPYGKEVRAHCVYTDFGLTEKPTGSTCEWRSGSINAIDTILTKKTVPAGGEYGDAPVRIVNSWMTSLEDGYLTLVFEGFWSTRGIVHTINLAKTDDPLTFELKHNSNGDTEPLYAAQNLVAFDLHDLPVPDSSEYDVTVKYVWVAGERNVKFHYKNGSYSRPEFSANDEQFE